MNSTEIWLLIGAMTVMSVLVKGLGPALVGGRTMPEWATRVIGAMAPALLAALIVTAALSDGRQFRLGADAAGVAVAAVLLVLRVPLVGAVIVAVAITAGVRAVA